MTNQPSKPTAKPEKTPESSNSRREEVKSWSDRNVQIMLQNLKGNLRNGVKTI